MASRDQSKQRKLEILNQLSSQRSQIAAKKKLLTKEIAESKEVFSTQLKDKVNVPKMVGSKLKSSFSNSPNQWFIASAVGGLVISKILFKGKRSKPKSTRTIAAQGAATSVISSIFRKPKEREQTHGLFYSLIGYAARPMIKSFAINKVRNYLTHKIMMQQQYDNEYSQYPQRPRKVYDEDELR